GPALLRRLGGPDGRRARRRRRRRGGVGRPAALGRGARRPGPGPGDRGTDLLRPAGGGPAGGLAARLEPAPARARWRAAGRRDRRAADHLGPADRRPGAGGPDGPVATLRRLLP